MDVSMSGPELLPLPKTIGKGPMKTTPPIDEPDDERVLITTIASPVRTSTNPIM